MNAVCKDILHYSMKFYEDIILIYVQIIYVVQL
jgi:hypothetical protein